MVSSIPFVLLLGLAACAQGECLADDYVYQTIPAPLPSGAPSPLETKYSALLNQTCAAALKHVPVLPAADAAKFMADYTAFDGYKSEADVIKSAAKLLSNKGVAAFFALPDSFGKGGLDANLVLCRVLVDATPAALANYSMQGKAQEATVDDLLANTMLMRDMLVAGGQPHGQYGQAAALYAKIIKASAVLSSPPSPVTPWDDRSQDSKAVLRRAALGTALEQPSGVHLRFAQTATPPWGPSQDPSVTSVDPVQRYLHYETAYLAGDLDPAFEVLSAFEMRHTTNADAANGDLAWMRETMGNYGPNYIAMNYSVGNAWRYAESVHYDVAYSHNHCPQPLYTTVCSGHYSMIPALGGICGFRAFWTRVTRKAFGLPTWGAKHTGHAAMSSWDPQGWIMMLAGSDWNNGVWTDDGGPDYLLDTRIRELQPAYQTFLRGSWAATARGDAPSGKFWQCNYAYKGKCGGFGVGGLWSALMLYYKKAVVAPYVKTGTSTLPVRAIGPSSVPTKVGAFILRWNATVPPPEITTDAAGTIIIPAPAYSPAATTANVTAMKSFFEENGTQLLHPGGDYYTPEAAALVYQFTAETAGKYYLTANHSTWHADLDLRVAVNGQASATVPVYLTLGYWNETQPVEVTLVKGVNNVTFTRLTMGRLIFKNFNLYTSKPKIPAPPGGGFTPQPISPPLPASSFIEKPPSTSCVLQGIQNVPEDECADACKLVANGTYTGPRPTVDNVAGCFVIVKGMYKGNCNYNANASGVCKPPCGVGGDKAELCLVKSR